MNESSPTVKIGAESNLLRLKSGIGLPFGQS